MYSFERFQPNPIPNNRSISTNKGANVAINYNFIFSPTVLYEFVGGYNRATIPFGNEPRGAGISGRRRPRSFAGSAVGLSALHAESRRIAL